MIERASKEPAALSPPEKDVILDLKLEGAGVLRAPRAKALRRLALWHPQMRASHLCHYQLNSEISVVGKKNINCLLTPAISWWRRSDNYPALWSPRAQPDSRLPTRSARVFNAPLNLRNEPSFKTPGASG